MGAVCRVCVCSGNMQTADTFGSVLEIHQGSSQQKAHAEMQKSDYKTPRASQPRNTDLSLERLVCVRATVPPPERATSEGQNGTLEDRVGYQFGRTAASSDQKWLRDAAVYTTQKSLWSGGSNRQQVMHNTTLQRCTGGSLPLPCPALHVTTVRCLDEPSEPGHKKVKASTDNK